VRPAKPLLAALCLAALAIPLVYAITFIGGIVFVGPQGGNVTFTQTFQASRLNYDHNVNFFTNLVWGPRLQGNIGIDADLGVNVTVTAITRDQIRYTVTTLAPGPVDTYIYYYRNVRANPLTRPTEVTAGGAAAPHTYAGGVTTVTTTGSPVNVIMSYGVGDTGAGDTIDILLTILPLIALFVALEGRKQNLIDNKVMVMVLLIAALGVMVWLLRAYGY